MTKHYDSGSDLSQKILEGINVLADNVASTLGPRGRNVILQENKDEPNELKSSKNKKIYINLTALDKITAKTSSFRMAVGDKKSFGPLEIKALKCQVYESNQSSDTVAYIQVKDLSAKDNDQVFL